MSTLKLWFLGLRKTLVTLIFLFTTALLLLAGYLPSETWLENLRYVMIAYLGANACEHGLNIMGAAYEARRSKSEGTKASTSGS